MLCSFKFITELTAKINVSCIVELGVEYEILLIYIKSKIKDETVTFTYRIPSSDLIYSENVGLITYVADRFNNDYRNLYEDKQKESKSGI